MAAQNKLESYTELAELCLWEADRTLDQEVARSLRSLAERYERMSQRSLATEFREHSSVHRGEPHYHR
jgi:hypothetical protein